MVARHARGDRNGHLLLLLFGEATSHRPVLAAGAHDVQANRYLIGRAAARLAAVALRLSLLLIHLIGLVTESEDHRDVIRAHLVLQPQPVRLRDDRAARIERIGELQDHVRHRLVGEELPHTVRGQHDELVFLCELLAQQLGLGGDSDSLGHRVAYRARKRAAREALPRRPHARWVPAVVELLAEVDPPVLVVWDDALELVARHHDCASRLDTLTLVLPVGRLINRERVRDYALALLLPDDRTRVANIGDGELRPLEEGRDGGGTTHRVIEILHASHAHTRARGASVSPASGRAAGMRPIPRIA